MENLPETRPRQIKPPQTTQKAESVQIRADMTENMRTVPFYIYRNKLHKGFLIEFILIYVLNYKLWVFSSLRIYYYY